jgi:hypothetical protein
VLPRPLAATGDQQSVFQSRVAHQHQGDRKTMGQIVCKNCNSSRRRVFARGYCSKCYHYVHLVELARKWDLSNPSTLKRYPGGLFLRKSKDFAKVKLRVPKQWQERLDWLRDRERYISGKIDGIDIEYALQRIANLAGSREPGLFHGIAGHLDDVFDREQRRELFKLMDKIELSIPWRGVNWHEVFSD